MAKMAIKRQGTWKKRKSHTSNGYVGNPVLAGEVDCVGKDAVKGLCNHGKVGGVQEELEGRGVHVEGVLEKEVDGHPWEAPETLHPVAQA